MDSARYVIIGAGLAGASTAYHLAQAGERDLLILEREDLPGRIASSQNAGMIRQIVEDPEIAALAREGTRKRSRPCAGRRRRNGAFPCPAPPESIGSQAAMDARNMSGVAGP